MVLVFFLGFALRCKELESQLGILIKNFLEKKIAEKMTKKKKREENVVYLIESIEERPVSICFVLPL